MKCPNGGKVGYKSLERAKEVRKTLQWRRKGSWDVAVKVYQCPYCRYYHLTTKGY